MALTALTSVSPSFGCPLVASASVMMPILPRLDMAVSELSSLQDTLRLGVGVSLPEVRSAYNALLPVDDALPQGELEEIGLNLETDFPSITAARMTQHLTRLQGYTHALRNGLSSLFREEDVRAYRSIVGETRPFTGGLLGRTATSVPSRVPDWAQMITARWKSEQGDGYEYPIMLRPDGTAIVGSSNEQGATSELKGDLVAPKHFEIRFTTNGRYWIRDLESEIGTLLNGQSLKPLKWYELEEEAEIGFKLEVGQDPELLIITFQDRDPLERCRAQIAAAPTFEALIELLRSQNRDDLASSVEMFVENGVGLGQIPETGGLGRRVKQLVAERDFHDLERPLAELHRRYAGTLPQAMFLTQYQGLALAIQNAKTIEDVLTALRLSPVPKVTPLIKAVRTFADGDRDAYGDIPADFGLRAKIREIASARLSERAHSDLEKMHISVEDFFSQPWKEARVSQALKLTLAGLRQDGKKQRDFTALKALIDSWEGEKQGYVGLTMTDPNEPQMLEHDDRNWRYVGDLYPAAPFTARMDLVVDTAQEQPLWDYLSERLFAIEPPPFQMRMPKAGTSGAPTTIAHLYFDPARQQEVYQSVTAMAAAHPEFLKGGVNPFTLPLKNEMRQEIAGIRFSQLPPAKFGISDTRIHAMNNAIQLVELFQADGQEMNWNEIYQIFAYSFERAGFDPSQPALLLNRENELQFLLNPPRAKKSRKTGRDESGVRTKDGVAETRKAK